MQISSLENECVNSVRVQKDFMMFNRNACKAHPEFLLVVFILESHSLSAAPFGSERPERPASVWG